MFVLFIYSALLHKYKIHLKLLIIPSCLMGKKSPPPSAKVPK